MTKRILYCRLNLTNFHGERRMKRKSLALFILAVFIVTTSIFVFSACGGEAKEGNGAKLLFFDDFDSFNTEVWNVYTAKTEIDEGWGPEDGIRRGGYWDKGQVFTENGNLVIRTEIRDGVAYTGAIDSDNKLEMHYGYYETRCKVPQAPGIWSAFWIFCDEMGGSFKRPRYKRNGDRYIRIAFLRNERPYFSIGNPYRRLRHEQRFGYERTQLYKGRKHKQRSERHIRRRIPLVRTRLAGKLL